MMYVCIKHAGIPCHFVCCITDNPVLVNTLELNQMVQCLEAISVPCMDFLAEPYILE